MKDWNPEQYLKYKSERSRPAEDLIARIAVGSPGSIIDVGCGPGNVTQMLRHRWPYSEIVGVDSSESMIARAREDYPDQQWITGDAAALDPAARYDIVFTNAMLQWLPNHHALIPRLLGLVRRGGALAVQVPANHESPLHRALVSVASQEAWTRLGADRVKPLTYHEPEFYYDLLHPLAADVDLWATTYHHALGSHRELIEWYGSTGMRPYLDALPDDAHREKFRTEVLDECREEYPAHKNGKILFPFRRIFFIAYV